MRPNKKRTLLFSCILLGLLVVIGIIALWKTKGPWAAPASFNSSDVSSGDTVHTPGESSQTGPGAASSSESGQLGTAPVIVSGDTEIPYSTEPVTSEEIEHNRAESAVQYGVYRNDKILSIELTDGSTAFVGLQDESLDDAIYFNTVITPKDGDRFSQYILVYLPWKHPIQYSSEDGIWSQDAGEAQETLVTLDYGVDHCIPSRYQGKNEYGVRWTADFFLDDGTFQGDTVDILVYLAGNRSLIDVIRVSISGDAALESWEIDAVTTGNSARRGDLSDEEQEAMLAVVDSFCKSPDLPFMQVGVATAEIDRSKPILFHDAARPYLMRYLGPGGYIQRSNGDPPFPLYAVSLTFGVMNLTIYLERMPVDEGVHYRVMGANLPFVTSDYLIQAYSLDYVPTWLN